ncbi:thiol reductant ABC exporter subunit CydC [Pseudonocardiaceae bacterium YIM PH 21723]|nr:thiol reductant ABC exporter subunit CydC [Pseudonocardiaceae bacterium YIM PH 21723]
MFGHAFRPNIPDFGTSQEPLELRVTGLRVRRRDGFAPDGADFVVRSGEITRLSDVDGLGASGAGKSTVFSTLLGFSTVHSGLVTINGAELSTVDHELWRTRLAWVPQRPTFTHNTVEDELRQAVSDQPGPAPSSAELESAAASSRSVHLLGRVVHTLSTGERQRVAIARAVLRVQRGARLLLLDEPTAHLDDTTAAFVLQEIRRLADSGVAVLLAAHREAVADLSTVDFGDESTVDEPVDESAERVPLRGGMFLGAVLLGAATACSGAALIGVAGWLIAKAATMPPILTLSVAVLGVRFFALTKAVLRYTERLVSHRAAFRLATDLRVRLWGRIVGLGPARTLELRRGEGLRRMVDDVDQVRDLVPRTVLPTLTAVLVAVLAVFAQALVDPAAGAVLAGGLVVAVFLAPALALLAERRATTALAADRRRFAGRVLTMLEGAADLIAMGAHRPWLRRAAEQDAELTGRTRRQALGAGAGIGLATLTMGLTALGCLVTGLGRLDPLLVPVVTLIPLALLEVVLPLTTAAQYRVALQAALGRLGLPEVGDVRGTERRLRRHGGQIDLRRVSVGWPNGRGVLSAVDLRVPTGAWVSVVGPSGAGKSTLGALLLGFLPPSAGTAVLPERVSWSPQEPQLVSISVRENLRLGDPEATDDQLRQALRAAQLPEWTDRLDTLAGTTLSGGEAARLAVARALLALPHSDVLLLDEPTAHLDPDNTRRLLDELRFAARGRTVVHITHDPALVAPNDLVIEVGDGRITRREPSRSG